MYNTVVLRKLGNVLLMETDPELAQRKAGFLSGNGTKVTVVEHPLQALTELGVPNHGFTLVFLGNQPMYPDVALRTLLERMELSE